MKFRMTYELPAQHMVDHDRRMDRVVDLITGNGGKVLSRELVEEEGEAKESTAKSSGSDTTSEEPLGFVPDPDDYSNEELKIVLKGVKDPRIVKKMRELENAGQNRKNVDGTLDSHLDSLNVEEEEEEKPETPDGEVGPLE